MSLKSRTYKVSWCGEIPPMYSIKTSFIDEALKLYNVLSSSGLYSVYLEEYNYQTDILQNYKLSKEIKKNDL